MNTSRWAPNAPAQASEPTTYAEPAPPESSSIPVPYDNAVDSYDDYGAQTRAEDDLFDDDFTPIPQPTIQRISGPSTPSPPRTNSAQRARGGRGQRRAQGPSRASPPAKSTSPPTHDTASPKSPTAPPAAPLTAPDEKPKPTTPAVRGDRTATGGLPRAKLSEAELAAKMAAISLKNASLTAAHERAEADLATFEKREKEASERAAQVARVEKMKRRAMEGEREANRMRKLKAVGGREWDLEKEEGFVGLGPERARGGRGRGGGYRDVEPPVGFAQAPPVHVREDDPIMRWDDGGLPFCGRGRGNFHTDKGRPERGRGRGGRGGGAGRGMGRGDGPALAQSKHAPQSPPTPAQFPDLPAPKAKAAPQEVKPATKLEFPIKPAKKQAADEKDGSKTPPGAKTPPEVKPSKGTQSPPKAAANQGVSEPTKSKGTKKDNAAASKTAAANKPPAPKKRESFGLTTPTAAGGEKKSWADQVEGAL
ncbi:hypothetical protein H2201_002592 [Coniosporium apollinis]|uniref:Hyaluronan/mRNA-binding protein domain-containing protein n=1 Tax=Coniosporium apollinis TaxID=61459 RepID=A0ABQ9P085_9PEZI|nr:hypothetical protein H2201_002592 [Coniosporium apollinis]